MALSVRLLIFCGLHFVLATVNGQGEPTWSYDYNAPDGPPRWGNNFPNCSGQSQSPINIIPRNAQPDFTSIKFYNYEYYIGDMRLINDGHSATLKFPMTGNRIPYMTASHLPGTYKLENIHFHWGSNSRRGAEHTIDARTYPMEVHLVHIQRQYASLEQASLYTNGIAVLGAFYTISRRHNRAMNAFLNHFHSIHYKHNSVVVRPFNLFHVFGSSFQSDGFFYDGSLTTPPCNEGVKWTVFRGLIPISEQQIRRYRQLQKETKPNDPNNDKPLVDNFRPIQQLNGRIIHRYSVTSVN